MIVARVEEQSTPTPSMARTSSSGAAAAPWTAAPSRARRRQMRLRRRVIIEGKSGAVLDGRPIAYLGSKTSCGGVIVECAGTATFV